MEGRTKTPKEKQVHFFPDPTFITTRTEQELARDIKEKYCYISVDPEIENSNEFTDIKNYEMWDGRIVPLGMEQNKRQHLLERNERLNR